MAKMVIIIDGTYYTYEYQEWKDICAGKLTAPEAVLRRALELHAGEVMMWEERVRQLRATIEKLQADRNENTKRNAKVKKGKADDGKA